MDSTSSLIAGEKFPRPVLRRIFRLLLENSGRRRRIIFATFQLVCRHWRHATNKMHDFWNSLRLTISEETPIADIRAFAAVVRRSEGFPLDLWICFGGDRESYCRYMWDFLKPSVHRWRSIHIEINYTDSEQEKVDCDAFHHIGELLSQPMPLLEKCEIDGWGFCPQSPAIQLNTPKLRDLTLLNLQGECPIRLGSEEKGYPALESFHIYGVHLVGNDFWSILRTSRLSLKSITITKCRMDMGSNVPEILVIPNVVGTLTADFGGDDTLWEFLRRVDCPKARELCINAPSWRGSPKRQSARFLTAISYLTWSPFHWNVVDFERILALCPQLTALTLTCRKPGEVPSGALNILGQRSRLKADKPRYCPGLWYLNIGPEKFGPEDRETARQVMITRKQLETFENAGERIERAAPCTLLDNATVEVGSPINEQAEGSGVGQESRGMMKSTRSLRKRVVNFCRRICCCNLSR